MRLKDKVAVITGGARGIGEALCLALGREGAAVAVVDVVAPTRTMAQLRDAGAQAMEIVADVTDSGRTEDMARVVLERFGRIDILVNNAALLPRFTPFEAIDEDAWDRVMAAFAARPPVVCRAYQCRRGVPLAWLIRIFRGAATSAMRYPVLPLHQFRSGDSMLSIAAVVITLAASTSSPGVNAAENLQQDAPAAGTSVARSEGEEIRGRVKVGQKVTITDDSGRQIEGRIGTLQADRLSIVSRTEVTELPYERIVRIDRPHDGLGNGARWGFATGAVLGFALVLQEEAADCEPGFFSCGDPHPAAYALVPGIIGGLGAAIGVCVDALIRRERNIYSRGRGASVRVVPRLGRGRAGGALSVSW